MASGYEKATKEIIPAVRYALVKSLKTKYKKREEEIAQELGMTQAAISKYFNGKLSDKVKALEKKIDAKVIDSCARSITEGNSNMANACICSVCNKFNDFGCGFSKAAMVSAATATA